MNRVVVIVPQGQGDIGAAVSRDGGASFEHLGVVLDEPWHLAYPHVFKHDGQVRAACVCVLRLLPLGLQGARPVGCIALRLRRCILASCTITHMHTTHACIHTYKK